MHDYLGHPLGLVGWFARTIQAISSIIVLGITAWAVSEDNKTLSVIFSLVIVSGLLRYIFFERSYSHLGTGYNESGRHSCSCRHQLLSTSCQVAHYPTTCHRCNHILPVSSIMMLELGRLRVNADHYRWLTSFILLALNFNRRTCRVNRWIGEVSCSRSYTAEAFSFIAL